MRIKMLRLSRFDHIVWQADRIHHKRKRHVQDAKRNLQWIHRISRMGHGISIAPDAEIRMAAAFIDPAADGGTTGYQDGQQAKGKDESTMFHFSS